MQLVPMTILEAADPALQARIAAMRERLSVNPDDSVYGRPFRYYLLFTHWPSLLPGELRADDVFYNRYYWLRRFACLYRAEQGDDAGIEQQVMQLLEEAAFRVEWDVIEQIDAQARRNTDYCN